MLLSPVGLNPINMHRTTNRSCSKPNVMVGTISLMKQCGCSSMFLNTRIVRTLIQNGFSPLPLTKRIQNHMSSLLGEWTSYQVGGYPKKTIMGERGGTSPALCRIKLEIYWPRQRGRDHKKMNFNILKSRQFLNLITGELKMVCFSLSC